MARRPGLVNAPPMGTRAWWGVILLAGIAGCGQSTTLDDDAGVVLDGGGPVDAGPSEDAGPPPVDVGHDAAPPMPCTMPGAMEMLPCGMCGTISRFCTSDLVWAYGACAGEHGECMPGTTDTVACGRCGTQQALCDTTCTWNRTGTCAGEGACAAGSRTRVSTGCPAGQTQDALCDDACTLQPTGACMPDPCPRAGASDTIPCGNCGTMTRFCGSDLVWQYGVCAGEGPCAPGTMRTGPCGNCGTQPLHCTSTCQEVPSGACAGEGECAPGSVAYTSDGCPAGQTRPAVCGDTCMLGTGTGACSSTHPVDVTFVLDITGSNMAMLMAAVPGLEASCITPLLGLTDVDVGVSFTGEYPLACCGETDDHPFIGGVEPTHDAATITSTIAGRGMMIGGDFYDGTLAPLWMLSGGAPEQGAIPLTCSSGRTPGGCWRATATRVVVVYTDSPIHGGPAVSGTGIEMPYTGATTPPVTWPDVRTQMLAQGVLVIWLDSAFAPGDEATQFRQMLSELGQPASDLHDVSMGVGTACDALVARVRALSGG